MLRTLALSFHSRSVRAALAVQLVVLITPLPSLAAELKEAIEAVERATDAELLAELQRRYDARREVPAALNKSLQGREIETGLDRFDEPIFDKAIRIAKTNGRVIYGDDDRKDWHEITDPEIKRIASAAVALFSSANLQAGGSGAVKLKTEPLGERKALCQGETFANQSVGAFCSGTLVREDVVLTAGHCAREVSGDPKIPYVTSVSFVFGYYVEKPGFSGATVIPNSQIFKGQQVLAGELAGERGKDWALVKLDRPVPASLAKPITSWQKTKVAEGQDVFVIGYPSGLPLKYAPGAEVRDAVSPIYFTANLDTFGGNSGSGVFDTATGELAGVLVRGETDYFEDKASGCWRVNVCPSSGCRGEDVTRISLVPTP